MNMTICYSETRFMFVPYFYSLPSDKLWKTERDRNTRPPDLPLEKPVGRSGSNS